MKFCPVVPEICRGHVHAAKKERRIIITRIAIAKQWRTSPYPMAPNSKNDDDYQFARPRSTWKPNFAQIEGFFLFWRPFWIQNGRHRKPKLSPYGAACLTPCNYPFPLKSFHFWIFNNLFWFYIGSHFEMLAILKILKTKSTTLSDHLFLCQVSKGSAVRSEFNIVCTLVTIAPAANLNFFIPQQLPHNTVDIPTKFHEVW